MEVELYVYDLSRGLARQLSGALLGTQIDAVYHTAIVFGGVEIFFGLGVQTCRPGSTHHGAPMRVIPLGTTSLPQDVIYEYLESLRQIYTPESYDLFLHNCNNFSNDFATFLVGRGIPEYVTSLPQTVLNTPFGQMLKPQLDNAMRSMTQAPLPPSSAPAAGVVRPSRSAGLPSGASANSMNGAQSMKSPGIRAHGTGVVHNVTSLREIETLLDTASRKCAVIFFTSSTCAPCKIVYPAYDELAAEAGKDSAFIKVDIRQASDAAAKYGVMATPTFMTFLHGEKENEWTGADERKLRGNVGLLLQMARHPHLSLHLPHLLGASKRPLTYAKVPPLDKLVMKMGDAGRVGAVEAVKDFVATRTTEGSKEATLPDLAAFSAFLKQSTLELPEDRMFAVVDLVRIAVIDPRVSGYFAEEHDHQMLQTILDYVNKDESQKRPYPLRLTTLQLLCNMFTTPLFATQTLQESSVVSPIIQLLSADLIDGEHENLRIAAASLTFNLAVATHQQRTDGGRELFTDGDQLQLLVATVEALSAEQTSVEAFKRNLLALGLLVYCAPNDAEIFDFVKAADVAGTVKEKAKLFPKEKKLIHEIGEELLREGLA